MPNDGESSERQGPATFAVLGLLAVKPWTGYELAQQAHRSLRYIWPTSEAHLYREQKRLVRLGWATAEQELVGRRPRTRYSITDDGRAALEAWGATEPGHPGFEVEGNVRLFFGDQLSVDALVSSMRLTSEKARERLDEMLGFVEDYLDNGGPFPHRLHVVSMVVEIVTGLLAVIEEEFAKAADEVSEWETTKDRGLDDDTRRRLERIKARHSLREE